jgi:thymidylate synthase (FAD)
MRLGILDHGYIELVEHWGSDERIVEAARMSTGKGFLGWGPKTVCAWCLTPEDNPKNSCMGGTPHVFELKAPGDEKLLRTLWENKHATPFEMAGAIVEVQAPIFVFREWHRHRTQSFNELSARYTPMPDLAYLPDAEDAVRRSEAAAKTRNKQAGKVADAEVLTLDAVLRLLQEEADLLVTIEDLYRRKLKAGFPKELARTHLTVSRYSRMRASANLRNWLTFLTLREASSAQQEIRQYAHAVHAILVEKFPRTMALFEEKRP